MRSLAQNGIIFHIRRNLDALLVDDSRPLSSSKERLMAMEKERMPLYQKYSQLIDQLLKRLRVQNIWQINLIGLDLSQFDLSENKNLIYTSYDTITVWPEKLPATFDRSGCQYPFRRPLPVPPAFGRDC